MVAKIEKVSKAKRIGKIGKRKRVTMKGLYYRELIKRMFNKNNRITIEENKPVEVYSSKEKHILDKFV